MIADELQELLGEKDFIKLVENFGGTRLYIAHPDSRMHKLGMHLAMMQPNIYLFISAMLPSMFLWQETNVLNFIETKV